MIEEFIARRFVVARIAAIPGAATLWPGGIHEDEAPQLAAGVAPQTTVIVQVEAPDTLQGMGGVIILTSMLVLVDVSVPGKTRLAGLPAATAIRSALHLASGTVTGGRILSCSYLGFQPMPPEHTGGHDYEHLMMRFQLSVQPT